MAQDHCADVQELFPPAICAVALDVIRLLDDTALDNNKLSGKMIQCKPLSCMTSIQIKMQPSFSHWQFLVIARNNFIKADKNFVQSNCNAFLA